MVKLVSMHALNLSHYLLSVMHASADENFDDGDLFIYLIFH